MRKETVAFVNEARMEIGDTRLTSAQSGTVRCALNGFIAFCDENREELGPIAQAYIERSREVLRLIHEDIR